MAVWADDSSKLENAEVLVNADRSFLWTREVTLAWIGDIQNTMLINFNLPLETVDRAVVALASTTTGYELINTDTLMNVNSGSSIEAMEIMSGYEIIDQ